MAKSARGWLAQVYLTRLQGAFRLRRESALTGVCWEAWRRGWTLHRTQLLDAMTRSHKLYFIKIWRRWRLAVQVSLHFRLCERHAELKDSTCCLRRCVLGWSTHLAARIAEAHFLFEARAAGSLPWSSRVLRHGAKAARRENAPRPPHGSGTLFRSHQTRGDDLRHVAGIRNVAQKANDALSRVDCAGGITKAKKSSLLPCSACATSETIAELFLWSQVAPSAALRPRLVQRDAVAVTSTASTVGCAAPLGRVGVGMAAGALAVKCCPDATVLGQCCGATAACSPGCGGVVSSQAARPARRTQPLGSFSKGGVLACTGGVARRG